MEARSGAQVLRRVRLLPTVLIYFTLQVAGCYVCGDGRRGPLALRFPPLVAAIAHL